MQQKPVQSKNNLQQLRNALLHLHKALLDFERFRFQRAHRQKFTAAQLYRIVLDHKDFVWLRQLSELIVGMDELLDNGKHKQTEQIDDLVKYVKKLLTASVTGNKFEKKYYQAIQREPAVVLAHAKIIRLLKNYPASN
jgi:hypothetical protein